MKSSSLRLALALALSATALSAAASSPILDLTTTASFSPKSFSGTAMWTYDSVFDLDLGLSGYGTSSLSWTLALVGSPLTDSDSFSISSSSGFNQASAWEGLSAGSYSFSYSGKVGSGSKLSLTLNSTPIVIAEPAGPVTPAVPEPETYAMLLAGLGMVGLIARRRMR